MYKLIPKKVWSIYTKKTCQSLGNNKSQSIKILFLNLYKIDLLDAEKCKDLDKKDKKYRYLCAKQFKDLNDIFTRKRVDIRIDPFARIVSPADSMFSFYESQHGRDIMVKSHKFEIHNMLDNRKELIEKFENAAILIFYLSPKDYHRFHVPIDNMKIKRVIPIAGDYYTVKPGTVKKIPVYDKNKRAILELEDENVIMLIIGATCVGSIDIDVNASQKGEELGMFKFGGSTCILLVNNLNTDEIEKLKKMDGKNVKVGDRILL